MKITHCQLCGQSFDLHGFEPCSTIGGYVSSGLICPKPNTPMWKNYSKEKPKAGGLVVTKKISAYGIESYYVGCVSFDAKMIIGPWLPDSVLAFGSDSLWLEIPPPQ